MIYQGQPVTPAQAASIIANRLKRRDPNYLSNLRDRDAGKVRVGCGNIILGLLVVAVVAVVIWL